MTTTKTCRSCGADKALTDFYLQRNCRNRDCKACKKLGVKSWVKLHPEQTRSNSLRSYHERRQDPFQAARMQLNGARARATKEGLPFDLTIDAIWPIPDICPALGIPMNRDGGKGSPSNPTLDRLIPEKGYVVGNVTWLSNRANRLKNNGTPDELLRIGHWFRERLPAPHTL